MRGCVSDVWSLNSRDSPTRPMSATGADHAYVSRCGRYAVAPNGTGLGLRSEQVVDAPEKEHTVAQSHQEATRRLITPAGVLLGAVVTLFVIGLGLEDWHAEKVHQAEAFALRLRRERRLIGFNR